MPRRNYRQKPKLSKQVFITGCHKQSFTNAELAERAAQDQMLSQHKLSLSVYRCPFCQGWHLTSQVKMPKNTKSGKH